MHSDLDHFAIDLETLGTRYNAAVVSIGVVAFNPQSGELGKEFYREIDLNSAIKSGTITGSTLQWWVNQSPNARRVFSDNPGKVPLAQALDELTQWLRSSAVAPKVWGNGVNADITVLEHAYDVGCVGLKEAWHFTNIRDMRTIVDVAALDHSDWPATVGTHHNALDDAKWQAMMISRCWRKCRGLPIIAKPGKTAQKVEDDEEL